MPKPVTGNTELVQFRISKAQKQMLAEYAASQNTTIAELARQQLRALLGQMFNRPKAG